NRDEPDLTRPRMLEQLRKSGGNHRRVPAEELYGRIGATLERDHLYLLRVDPIGHRSAQNVHMVVAGQRAHAEDDGGGIRARFFEYLLRTLVGRIGAHGPDQVLRHDARDGRYVRISQIGSAHDAVDEDAVRLEIEHIGVTFLLVDIRLREI